MVAEAWIGFVRNVAVVSLEYLISSWTDDRHERRTERSLPVHRGTFKKAENLRTPRPLPRTAIAGANLDCSA